MSNSDAPKWFPSAAQATNWLLSAVLALGVWVLLEQKTRVDYLEKTTTMAVTDIAVIKVKIDGLIETGHRIEDKLDKKVKEQ